MTQELQHWRFTIDQNHIAWLVFDKANSSTNTFCPEVLDEFSIVLTMLESESKLTGVVITSGKKKGFIAGADIESFDGLQEVTAAIEFIKKGQKIFQQLADFPRPTIALIDGFCLGGGMEMALACTHRIASDDPKTKLGLPEVMLGIHPGWGGCVRLPALIGALKAIPLILTGRLVSGKAAKKIGIVDDCVPRRQLERAATYYIVNNVPRHQPNWQSRVTNCSVIRIILSKIFNKKLSQRVRKEHYPAPYAVIENWLHEGVSEQAYAAEVDSIGHLITQNDTAKNLVRLFFLQEKLKGLTKHSNFKAKHVHVIGAGTMGGDIAAWCAFKGMYVTLQDQNAEAIAPAIKRAHTLYKKKLKLPRLITQTLDRLQPDLHGHGIKHADVIIEAVFEDLKVKQEIFSKLEAEAKPDAILATNTSSIPLAEIASTLQQPSRLVGIHFFNPVAKMRLVEVVQSDETDHDIVKQALSFVGQIDRLPLPVKSHPGFLINRILMPYLMECMAMLDEGYQAEIIDQAAEEFGMPVGPVALADMVGLDVCLSVAKNLQQHFGGSISDSLKHKVKSAMLGVKSGHGFYQYKKNKPIKQSGKADTQTLQQIRQRLILRIINEAAACLREGIISDADLLDAGMVFGTGFAPFRGGPMHHAKSVGVKALGILFQEYSQHFGERFKPDVAWQDYAA